MYKRQVRLDIRRIGAVKDGDNVIGSETRVKVVKNKIAAPFKQAEFQIPVSYTHLDVYKRQANWQLILITLKGLKVLN